MTTTSSQIYAPIPSLPGLPLLGNVLALRKKRLELLLHISHTFGDIGAFHFGPKLVPVLNSLELIRQVLVDQSAAFEKTTTVPCVVEAFQSSEGDMAENIAVVTLATLYLQQWWFFRLTFALGRLPSFPEAPFVSWWQGRHLPSPGSEYGRQGLLALQEYQQQRYHVPLNFLDDWQNQINHLLVQEEAARRRLSDGVREMLIQLSL